MGLGSGIEEASQLGKLKSFLTNVSGRLFQKEAVRKERERSICKPPKKLK